MAALRNIKLPVTAKLGGRPLLLIRFPVSVRTTTGPRALGEPLRVVLRFAGRTRLLFRLFVWGVKALAFLVGPLGGRIEVSVGEP